MARGDVPVAGRDWRSRRHARMTRPQFLRSRDIGHSRRRPCSLVPNHARSKKCVSISSARCAPHHGARARVQRRARRSSPRPAAPRQGSRSAEAERGCGRSHGAGKRASQRRLERPRPPRAPATSTRRPLADMERAYVHTRARAQAICRRPSSKAARTAASRELV
jgi:hypothetical protein